MHATQDRIEMNVPDGPSEKQGIFNSSVFSRLQSTPASLFDQVSMGTPATQHVALLRAHASHRSTRAADRNTRLTRQAPASFVNSAAHILKPMNKQCSIIQLPDGTLCVTGAFFMIPNLFQFTLIPSYSHQTCRWKSVDPLKVTAAHVTKTGRMLRCQVHTRASSRLGHLNPR